MSRAPVLVVCLLASFGCKARTDSTSGASEVKSESGSNGTTTMALPDVPEDGPLEMDELLTLWTRRAQTQEQSDQAIAELNQDLDAPELAMFLNDGDGEGPTYTEVEGDILVRVDANGGAGLNLGEFEGKKWPNGVLIYQFSATGNTKVSDKIRAAVNTAAKTLNDTTNVLAVETGSALYNKLVQRSLVPLGPVTVIERKNDVTCASELGYQGIGQYVTLSARCSTGSIVHELLHAFGRVHEQSRTDRDAYVDVFLKNALPDKRHNFEVRPTQRSTAVPYDLQSIMHYHSQAFCKLNDVQLCIGPTMAVKGQYPNGNWEIMSQRAALTPSDIKAVNTMYPTNAAVNAVKGATAPVVQPPPVQNPVVPPTPTPVACVPACLATYNQCEQQAKEKLNNLSTDPTIRSTQQTQSRIAVKVCNYKWSKCESACGTAAVTPTPEPSPTPTPDPTPTPAPSTDTCKPACLATYNKCETEANAELSRLSTNPTTRETQITQARIGVKVCNYKWSQCEEKCN